MAGVSTDFVIVVARLFLSALFLIFGWRKLTDYAGTVAQMRGDRVAAPVLAAIVAIFMELPVALAVAAGLVTRISALLFVIYTLGTSLVEHRYWAATGADRVGKMEEFYKNLSIMGGFLLLFVAGPGRYSIDALCNIAA